MALISNEDCSIQAITIQPGEPFNLPPGAEILSVSNINSLTSSCPLPNNLEEPECYILSFAAVERIGNDRPPYQGSSAGDGFGKTFFLRGVYAAGNLYPINITASSEGIFDVNSLATFMQTTPGLAGLFLGIGTGSAHEDDDDVRGGIATLCFRAVPSIAESMYIPADTVVIGVGVPEPDSWMKFYPIKRSDYIANNNNQTPAGTCGCA
jgi:hypothetical protein